MANKKTEEEKFKEKKETFIPGYRYQSIDDKGKPMQMEVVEQIEQDGLLIIRSISVGGN